MKMNNIQKIIQLISGYSPNETSARDDGYYQIDELAHQKKIQYVHDVCEAIDELKPVTDEEALCVIDFLDTENNMQENDRYHAFVNL